MSDDSFFKGDISFAHIHGPSSSCRTVQNVILDWFEMCILICVMFLLRMPLISNATELAKLDETLETNSVRKRYQDLKMRCRT